ncbi:MAG: exodeoxyribonuclease VII large subunit [Chloroflexi bacterium]|nr:exodeoxyribonuclease VII large subunit [Chloroflexota bacterium]MCC6895650.1 exodeoxyribonuclease VII large subunit [Anaerolineae bacterium]
MATQPEPHQRNIPSLNALIRSVVEVETLDYPFKVAGYVTRFYKSNPGNLYFDLTDDGYTISCIIRTKNVPAFPLGNGMDIEVYGTVKVYEPKAQIQIDVTQVRVLESQSKTVDKTLLEQLTAKGLWPRSKKPMPPMISKIGLVTSKQSDALHDFEDTYRTEGGTAAVRLSDVRLTGEQAPQIIANAITRFSHSREVDVIVLTRGGGRSAELATFDSLLIAEAICRSNIPVVTGIGHQRDRTLADEVADYMAITPTAVATYLARIKPPVQQQPVSPQQTKRQPNYMAALIFILALVIIALLLVNR